MKDREEDRLDAWLAELARDDAAMMPPPGLEARTLAAWEAWQEDRKRHPPRATRPPVWVAPALVGLAASMLVALAFAWQRLEPSASAPARVDRIQAPPAAVPARVADLPSSAARVSTAPAHDGRAGVARPSGASRPRRAAVPAEVETASFLPLGPDVERELSGSFQLSRVRVPRGVLVDLGLLMEAHRGGEPVQADVVFGEDGLARAIRLAPVSRRIP